MIKYCNISTNIIERIVASKLFLSFFFLILLIFISNFKQVKVILIYNVFFLISFKIYKVMFVDLEMVGINSFELIK